MRTKKALATVWRQLQAEVHMANVASICGTVTICGTVKQASLLAV